MPGLKILTTGGSGGLGNVTLELLLNNGFFVTDISNDVDTYSKKLLENKNFNFIKYDLKDYGPDTNLNLPFKIYDHILFMHANLLSKHYLDLTYSDFLTEIQVNLLGSFFVAQKIIKDWKNQGVLQSDRSLTFISSVSTKGGSPDELPYHSSKRAMEAAMLSFGRDLNQLNIRSNVITPGLMANKLGFSVIQKRPDALGRVPLGRPVDPKDVAEAILMCIKNKSMTGANIHINCGRYSGI